MKIRNIILLGLCVSALLIMVQLLLNQYFLKNYSVVERTIFWVSQNISLDYMYIGSSLIVICIILLIFIHELIYFFILKSFRKQGVQNVYISYSKRYMTGYVFFIGKLSIQYYILALIAPYVLLGLLPYIIFLWTTHIIVFFISIGGTIFAGADLAHVVYIYIKKIKYLESHQKITLGEKLAKQIIITTH